MIMNISFQNLARMISTGMTKLTKLCQPTHSFCVSSGCEKYRVSQKKVLSEYLALYLHTCMLFWHSLFIHKVCNRRMCASLCVMCSCVFVFVFNTTEVFWLCLHFLRGRSTCSLCHWPTHCDQSSFLQLSRQTYVEE